MDEEHVRRILKMVEDGKISAQEAQTLINALRTEVHGQERKRDSEPPREAERPNSHERGSKSFEFRWSQRRGLPLDLSALGKQISAVVSKIDPERILKDAGLGGRKLHDRVREWARAWQDDDVRRPVNPLGLPTARRSEAVPLTINEGSFIEVVNRAGSVTVIGGAASATVEVMREAWAQSEVEAQLKLGELDVDVEPEGSADDAEPIQGASRVSIYVSVPDDWHEGVVDLTIRVPSSVRVHAVTSFGDVRIENMDGEVEATAASGDIVIASVRGDVRTDSASGGVRASDIAGGFTAITKSGDVSAERLMKGAGVTTVSGDVHVADCNGGTVEARSVSGDIRLERVGSQGAVQAAVETVSGDVGIVQSTGSLSVRTVSGNVTAQPAGLTRFEAHSVSGDLELTLATAFSGTITISTVSGDVRVALPDGSSFRYVLESRSGDLHCEHPAADGTRSPHALSGTVGPGDGMVEIETLSGDVQVSR
jgi:DUF4097 and DUF4098 domain-containing protein YvlB